MVRMSLSLLSIRGDPILLGGENLQKNNLQKTKLLCMDGISNKMGEREREIEFYLYKMGTVAVELSQVGSIAQRAHQNLKGNIG